MGERLMKETWQVWYEKHGEAFREKFPEIEWTFIPPGGPHFNGVCERMIGSAKRAMAAIITPGLITHEQFTTFVVQAEGILNDRPLTYVSTDSEDPRALCPNDFLIGRVARDMSPYATEGWRVTKKLQFVNELLTHFWGRFLHEMVPQMQLMNKWIRPSRSLQVNDIVAVLDHQQRGRWPLAKVEEVKSGEDGKVREATIRQGGKIYTRPLCRLMILLPDSEWKPIACSE
jgi:hypothetical protein